MSVWILKLKSVSFEPKLILLTPKGLFKIENWQHASALPFPFLVGVNYVLFNKTAYLITVCAVEWEPKVGHCDGANLSVILRNRFLIEINTYTTVKTSSINSSIINTLFLMLKINKKRQETHTNDWNFLQMKFSHHRQKKK